jgi:chromosome segregation ATPase
MNYSLKSFTDKVKNTINNLTDSDPIDIRNLLNDQQYKANVSDLKNRVSRGVDNIRQVNVSDLKNRVSSNVSRGVDNIRQVNVSDLRDKIKIKIPQEKIESFKQSLNKLIELKNIKNQINKKKAQLNEEFKKLKEKNSELNKELEDINNEEKELIQDKERLRELCKALNNE